MRTLDPMRAQACRVLEVAAGGAMLAGAASLAFHEAASPVEMLATAVPGLPLSLAGTLVGLAAAAEAYVGIRLLVRSSLRVRWAALALLTTFVLLLASAGVRSGWSVRCGCLGLLWEPGLVGSLVQNTVLISSLLGAVALSRGQPGCTGPSAP